VMDSDYNVRRAALMALAMNYRDAEGTLKLLRERAVNDRNEYARRAALMALAMNYRDMDYVRKTAIEAIARHWPDHPDTLNFLCERAENDPTNWLREKAKKLADEIDDSR